MRCYLLAQQFLTRLPTPEIAEPGEKELGFSTLFYPLVGLLLGGLLWLAASLPTALTPELQAGVLLTLWVLLTGGLHLDGLADMADAWVGGHDSRERTLEIMKDPASGPIGVVALILLLLLKYLALLALLQSHALMVVVVTPLLARMALPLMMMTTPYVRREGLGSTLVNAMPKQEMAALLVLISVALMIWQLSFFYLLLATVVVVFLLRNRLMARLQGVTGDGFGALVELVEVVVLITAVATMVGGVS
ncbi:adenosylcobinamide-GDP ribazoletransferase [Candidatus Reidiella endopervernicosa]|uniref:Adenosylcobinamide-GDP ribazoletransferase n=1 Tax=Candidatus Reidiella endopervernicosa TaxID=2738883 RepID=A0A6N0I131_9GAMM|nr:adenosylcobinamide-GDP ribazoletransferase [Candidatus Reidiella endopervernicosa]